MQELTDFKDNFRQTIDNSNKRRDEEIKKLINDMNTVKNDIQKSFSTETQKPRQEFISFKNEVKSYNKDMQSKLDVLEEKQKKQMEQIRVLMANSSDKRIQKLSQHYLTDDHETFENSKKFYVKPSEDELSLIIEDLQQKKKKKDKSLNRFGSIQEDAELRKFIMQKKRNLAKLENDADMIEEENDEDLDNIENFKANKLTNVNEKVKYQRKEEFKKEIMEVNKKLQNVDVDDYQMTKLNKLRSYVYVALFQVKFRNAHSELTKHTRLEALKHFEEYYSTVETKLKSWVINSTKMAYLSVSLPIIQYNILLHFPVFSWF